MKLRNILLTTVLMISVSAAPVCAEEASAESPAEAAEPLSGVSEAVEGALSEGSGVLEQALSEAAGAVKNSVNEVSAAVKDSVNEASAAVKEASDGLLSSLLGEGGVLQGLLPEGTDIGGLADSIKAELGRTDSEISRVFAEISEKAQSSLDGFSADSLKQYAEELLGRFTGDGMFDDLESLFDVIASIREAEEQYILEHNAALMDTGDVQILSNDNIYQSDLDLDVIRFLSCVIQNNYRKDEENQLWSVSSAEDIVLFRQQKDEEGNYPVMEAVFAQEGEQFEASLEEMILAAGAEMTVDELLESIGLSRILVLFDLKEYLEEHPEIKGLEYDGEIRNVEELDAILDILLNAYSEEHPEDASAEEKPAEDASAK